MTGWFRGFVIPPPDDGRGVPCAGCGSEVPGERTTCPKCGAIAPLGLDDDARKGGEE